MKNPTATGNRAEESAAAYLVGQGFKILERNWRTRWCEIDIVAEKNGAVYFVEVKYRGSSTAGTGLDYITSTKMRQMAFAAEFWVSHNDFKGDYELSAIEIDNKCEVSNFIEYLT